MHEADGVNRHAAFLNGAARFIEGELAEGVDAGGDQENGFASFDGLHAVDGVGERIIKVRLGETGEAQALKGVVGFGAVGGEIRKDLGFEVIGDDGEVVFGLEHLREGVGGLNGLIPGLAVDLLELVGEFDHHADGHGGFADGVADDLLRDVIFENAEVLFAELGDGMALAIEHGNVHGDGGGVGGEGGDVDGLFLLGVLGRDLGLIGFRRRGRVGLFLGAGHGFAAIAIGSLSAGEEHESERAGGEDSENAEVLHGRNIPPIGRA